MSLTIAIATKDRIVVAADTKVTDTDTGEISLDSPKIFKLGKACVGLVTGEGLGDVDSFMANAESQIKAKRLKNVKTIANFIEAYAKNNDWMDDKTDKTAHLEMLVAGYDRKIPRVFGLLSTGKVQESDLGRYYFGVFKGTEYLLYDYFEELSYKEITYKQAEAAAKKMLTQAHQKFPEDVEGEEIWHIFPASIKIKN